MIGETIGHFKIVSRLGRGGMGEVYAGEHESIQTRVAIKILHAEISSDTEHVHRFFNEAKIVGKIKHAGIVKIFDVGHYQDHAYLIMELLEGEPLSARIDRSDSDQVPWQEAADLGRQIASVLDATHRAGVIHRDLKPDNIFLVADHELASGVRVKVLDFGISKLSGTMASNSPKTVGAMGTPAYMAPEQWGDSATIDWRADAYSLGCVIFEMVCGRPPFVTNTIFEACGKHLNATPPTPSSLANVPPELDELILRLLSKDPADRAVSMGQVSRELDAIASGRDLASIPAERARPISEPSITVPTTTEVGSTTAPAKAIPTPATMTTLGGSAAELQRTTARKRPAMIAGLVAGALVVALVVIVMTRPRGDKDPHPASPPEAPITPTPTPTPTPIASPTQPTPPATPTPPTPPATPTPATPTPVATPTPPVTPPSTPTLPTTPPEPAKHHPTEPAKHHPKPPPIPVGTGSAGSAATTPPTPPTPPPPPQPPPTPPPQPPQPPPHNGSDIGGRI